MAIIGKIYEYNFMDDNAFKLINYILEGIYNGKLTGLNSVDFPIKVLSIFRILKLDSPESSGIFCAFVMNLICFFFLLLKNGKGYSLKEYIFIYISFFILNFTVFDFSKDIIQFWFCFIIYQILSSQKISNKYKILLTLIIVLFEAIVFRSYYIMIAGLFPAIISLLKNISLNAKKKKIVLLTILVFVTFYLTVFIIQFISYSAYNELITRRDNLEFIKANTMIRDIIPGEGYGNFCINYFVNFIRCLFPIELCVKGIQYFLFALYEFFIASNIISSLKNITKNNLLILSFVLAYCMMLAASESDFGTFVRHQSVLIFFYLFIIIDNDTKRKEQRNKYYKFRIKAVNK